MAVIALARDLSVADHHPMYFSRSSGPSSASRSARSRVGDRFGPERLTAASGKPVHLPDPEAIVHLQLRRFAGCPICNLHLHQMAERHGEIAAVGVRSVVVFHSSLADLRRHAPDLPFDLVPDPGRRLYRALGVESSPNSLLNPRAWASMARGPAGSVRAALGGGTPAPPLRPAGGRLGLPGDFLISTDGRLLAVKYGEHAYDQWSVEELLGLVDRNRRSRLG